MIQRSLVFRISLLLCLMLIMVACGQLNQENDVPPDSGPVSGQLKTAGSSAMLPLIEAAAQEFEAQHPEAKLEVTGGGSGLGRQEVCNGNAGIGFSDIPLSDAEKEALKCQDVQQVGVIIQAFAPAANPQGPGEVTSLSKEILQAIFAGEITNWGEVGGLDQPIVIVHRQPGSGTRDNFVQFVFDGDASRLVKGAAELPQSEDVYQMISQTPGALGYLGFAYAERPGVVLLKVNNKEPTHENVLAGEWPIVGIGWAITQSKPTTLQQAFIDYLRSDEFQENELIVDLGYTPIPGYAR